MNHEQTIETAHPEKFSEQKMIAKNNTMPI
jgi:hypothetical protein